MDQITGLALGLLVVVLGAGGLTAFAIVLKVRGEIEIRFDMHKFINGLKIGAIKTYKYGYFAPLQAVALAVQRKGGYLWHLRALYRLCFGRR